MMLKRILLVALVVVTVVAASALVVVGYHVVYWSPSEEISFPSGDIELFGTIVKPAETGIFPAVILLHGSGPEPRADAPTRAVVNTLVRSGFAVLVYDKRGVGESGGDFDSATYRNFIDDAVAAVDYVSGRDDVDDERIGLYAVSESAWFAPEIAVTTRRIAFIFNKVGSPLSVVDTVRWEMRSDYRALGIAESDVDRLIELILKRWSYYRAAATDAGLASGDERQEIEQLTTRLRAEIPLADQVLPETLLPYDAERYRRLADDLFYDPAPYLSELDIPLYYAYGGSDINIPTEQCVAALEMLVEAKGKEISIKVYPGLGHSLATWRGILSVGFPPGYLDTLDSWTGDQLSSSRDR